MGFWQEYWSEDAFSKLKLLATPMAWVLRDGSLSHIPIIDVVPGDVARLEAGDRVPAGRLPDPQGLMLDASILTGESLPAERGAGEELFAGTLTVRGSAFVEITRTGAHSAMGRIATMLGVGAEAVGAALWLWIGAAVATSCGIAELYARLVGRRSTGAPAMSPVPGRRAS